MSSVTSVSLPALPYPDFPLRPHRNGQWYKSVWSSRSKKTEQFYFGSWQDDPKGERAITDPEIGWLARRDAIKGGVDNLRVGTLTGDDLTLGELMAKFLAFKRDKARAGELSLATLGDYLSEIEAFVAFMKPGTPAGGLKPEHFGAYMANMTDQRKLGRHGRKRVRAYVTAMLHYGSKNGWISMPNTGTEWMAPATDPDSMRQAKARAGIKDYSDRVLSGKEIDLLLKRANPSFKAMILLGINCAMGPADIGRLRWDMIDLQRGRLIFPRPKTGAMRVGYLWSDTREALKRVRTLKHNRHAILKEGEHALVFLTRKGQPFYREREVRRIIEVDGRPLTKLVGVAIHNAISITFGRMARELRLSGVRFYRLRHTFKTYAKRARDKEAIDVMMGHRDTSTGKVYDHEEIGWRRVKRVARFVHRRLWADVKSTANKQRLNSADTPAAGAVASVSAA